MIKNILIILFIFIFIIGSLFFIKENKTQKAQIETLKNELNSISILKYQNGKLFVNNSFEKDEILFSKSFVNIISRYSSPFGDGNSFKTLVKKYISNYHQDKYAAPRATENKLRYHQGIDLFVPQGTPLFPIGKVGIVTQVLNNQSNLIETKAIVNNKGKVGKVKVDYGRVVKILFPEGIETLYAHLDKIFVKKGQIVFANDIIGTTGYSGNIKNSGKDSHLHMELHYKGGGSFDPEKRLYFSPKDISIFMNEFDKVKTDN